MVFRDNGDHIKYHRRVPGIIPVWCGEGGKKRAEFFNPQPKVKK
jgi:hypothetical protein